MHDALANILLAAFHFSCLSVVLSSSLILLHLSVPFRRAVCRLFLMLRRFPIESRGRRKKLHEVSFQQTPAKLSDEHLISVVHADALKPAWWLVVRQR